MKQTVSILLATIILSCGNQEIHDDIVMDNTPWSKNQILKWENDSLTSVFYGDTIITIGPLSYGCFHYNHGYHINGIYQDGNLFYGESVLLDTRESFKELLNRLRKAKTIYHNSCTECGDFGFYYGTEQNFDIISIFYKIKAGEIDSALSYLMIKEPKWCYSSRYADLYLAILLDKMGRPLIEKHLSEISDINQQDSILIGSHWLHWQPIGEYNYKIYKEDIDWKHYFRTTLDRIEKQGI